MQRPLSWAKHAVFSALFLAAACGQPAQKGAGAPEVVAAETETQASDPAKSFMPSILAMLDQEMAAVVRDKKVASLSYVLIKDGQRVASGFHGTRTLDGADAVDDRTIYRIYSMTKPVTAVGLLMLYEEGKFELDDPISEFLPEMSKLVVFDGQSAGAVRTRPANRVPTIRELLLHTAGFGYGDGRQDYVSQQFLARQIDNAASSDDLVKKVAGIPLKYQPGEAWSYSIASDLQGAIIERITGQSLDQYLQERIFAPLGMADTGFTVDEADSSRLAVLTGWTPEAGMQLVPGPIQTLGASDVPRYSGGHGLVSTIADYERFAAMLLNGGTLGEVSLLKPETVSMMVTNGLTFVDPATGLPLHRPGRGVGFGFGVGVIDDTIASGLGAPEGSFYWDGAAGTWFWVDPRHDLIFIGMLQNMSSSPITMRRSAMQRVYHALITDYFPTSK
ncbi:MAG: serine hydrolase [Hyphomonas sp.]|uniref:serine hydrolase domain-containing protein n=1 Tax=Hyphomonas sp. TaxID=87 RepID=UPI001E154AFA|nr:serine hydrolase domain-containing protein [Hyphomonas sp.]MBA4226567.1 serine hydrolase [Hyphomonas sp.]